MHKLTRTSYIGIHTAAIELLSGNNDLEMKDKAMPGNFWDAPVDELISYKLGTRIAPSIHNALRA